MFRAIFAVGLISILAWGCTSRARITGPENQSLSGTWQEEYTLEFQTFIVEPPGYETTSVSAVSRLEADDSAMTVTIYRVDNDMLLPEREFIVGYTLTHDTVFFHEVAGPAGVDRDYVYSFKRADEQLELCSLPIAHDDGRMAAEMNGFLWSFGEAGSLRPLQKTCGSFQRVD
jgi:hypothetical protein